MQASVSQQIYFIILLSIVIKALVNWRQPVQGHFSHRKEVRSSEYRRIERQEVFKKCDSFQNKALFKSVLTHHCDSQQIAFLKMGCYYIRRTINRNTLRTRYSGTNSWSYDLPAHSHCLSSTKHFPVQVFRQVYIKYQGMCIDMIWYGFAERFSKNKPFNSIRSARYDIASSVLFCSNFK